ncbi:histone H1-II [Drosophila miranda]|uniref:histone H1-II n=1 Tax=Drosophila miranda TaxID=7229 RepID=UPI0007E67B7A|nr:histone H1-II [Drosophila miranda]
MQQQQPGTPGTPNSSAASTTTSSGGHLASRGCKAPGCTVSTVVEKTKRKCSQFVSSPYVIPKPVLVNGHSSVFQVGGEMAKVVDIPSISNASGGDSGKPIYRIKPGTHAHVMNFVLIDEGSDSLEKAMSGDQEAMRMVVDSQRESAISKLNKMVACHRGAAVAAKPTSKPPPQPATPAGNVHVTTPQIHPDFSIASVEGAVPFTGAAQKPAAQKPAAQKPAAQKPAAQKPAAAPTVAPAPAPTAVANPSNARLQCGPPAPRR